MKKTLFMLLVIGLCSPALAVSMNNDTSGDIQKVTFTWDEGEDTGRLNQELQLSKDTVITVGEGKNLTLYGNASGGVRGAVFGTYDLTKDGDGDLQVRLNDTLRNLDAGPTVTNDFGGSVTVEKGTLTLLHDTDDGVKKRITAYIGGGKDMTDTDTEITVKSGATLYMTDYTGINIPTGGVNTSNSETYKPKSYVQIKGTDELAIEGPKGWATPEGKNALGFGQISNAVVSANGIRNEKENERVSLTASSVILYDTRSDASVSIDNADVLAEDFTVNGHAEIRNTRIEAQVVASTAVAADARFETKVTNNSLIVCELYGNLSNVYVDATSKVQALDAAYLMLIGENKLDVNSISGVAKRLDTKMQYQVGDAVMDIATLTFNTDQLKGDMLYPETSEEFVNTTQLNVTLGDADLASLIKKYEEQGGVVFTLVLEGLDSSSCVTDQKTGALDIDLVSLTIEGYKNDNLFENGTISGVYDGKDTIFHFSMVANVDFNSAIEVPEPTTGTLSLLALAGLCARRRRK